MSQARQTSPVVLGAILVFFVLALGVGAYALNRIAAPPAATVTASSTPSLPASLRPTPSGSPLAVTPAAPCPAGPASHAAVASPPRTFAAEPTFSLDATRGYCAYMNTSKGLISIRLRSDLAPHTVNNFVFLARQGFYDGLIFHRVCPNSADTSCGGSLAIAQGGDPKGDGTGGPGYKFNDEPVTGAYTAGTLAMANSGPNTNGSQFFINTGDNSSLPKNYNLFGEITAGLDVAKSLVKGDTMLWVDIETTDLPVAASPSAAPVVSPVASPSPAADASPAAAPSPSPS
ncbi:MAG: peptidylprolyl isomerase [Candidatus Dormibacteria bacterium]